MQFFIRGAVLLGLFTLSSEALANELYVRSLTYFKQKRTGREGVKIRVTLTNKGYALSKLSLGRATYHGGTPTSDEGKKQFEEFNERSGALAIGDTPDHYFLARLAPIKLFDEKTYRKLDIKDVDWKVFY